MSEKAYKSMRLTGAANIALGIIVLAVGIAVGTISIVSGVSLLKKKNELTF